MWGKRSVTIARRQHRIGTEIVAKSHYGNTFRHSAPFTIVPRLGKNLDAKDFEPITMSTRRHVVVGKGVREIDQGDRSREGQAGALTMVLGSGGSNHLPASFSMHGRRQDGSRSLQGNRCVTDLLGVTSRRIQRAHLRRCPYQKGKLRGLDDEPHRSSTLPAVPTWTSRPKGSAVAWNGLTARAHPEERNRTITAGGSLKAFARRAVEKLKARLDPSAAGVDQYGSSCRRMGVKQGIKLKLRPLR